MQQEHAEERTLLGCAEPHRVLSVADLEWPEDQELHPTAFDEGEATVALAATGAPPRLQPGSTAVPEAVGESETKGADMAPTSYSGSARVERSES